MSGSVVKELNSKYLDIDYMISLKMLTILRFWLNMIKCATSLCQHRFINTLQIYLDAVVQQAADRSINHVRDIDSYFAIRRASSGIRPTFAICELYLNIPNSVMAHPVIEKLTELAVDMIFIDNDTVSYKVEWVIHAHLFILLG